MTQSWAIQDQSTQLETIALHFYDRNKHNSNLHHDGIGNSSDNNIAADDDNHKADDNNDGNNKCHNQKKVKDTEVLLDSKSFLQLSALAEQCFLAQLVTLFICFDVIHKR